MISTAFSKLSSFVSRNRLGVVLSIVAFAAVIGASAISGCSGLRDLISVKVPEAVQKETGATPKVSLNEAPGVRDAYAQNAVRVLAEFDASIGRGEQFYGTVASLFNTALSVGSDAASSSGLPFGGLLATGIGVLGGLFIEKPGSKAKAIAEKSNAADAAFDDGHSLALSVVNTAVESLAAKLLKTNNPNPNASA